MIEAISEKVPRLQNDGFSLIEVMVALVIFIIAFLGCYELQTMSSLSNAKANGVATAASWGTYVAEDLISREYTSTYTDPLLKNSTGSTANGGIGDIRAMTAATADGVRYVEPDGSINDVATGSDLYTIYWNIIDNDPLPSVKHIHIMVVKNSGLGTNSGSPLYSQDYFLAGPI